MERLMTVEFGPSRSKRFGGRWPRHAAGAASAARSSRAGTERGSSLARTPPPTRAWRAGTDVIRSMAERAGATITEAEGSHVIMVSQPETVANVILTAAATVDRIAAGAGT